MSSVVEIDNSRQAQLPSPVHVLQILGGSAYGGGTEMIHAIVTSLLNAGYSVTLVASDAKTHRKFAKLGIDVVSIPQMRRAVNPIYDVISLVKLIRLIRSGGYDVVHTHTSKAGLLGRFAAWISGVPVIIHHVHGFAFHEFSGRISRWLYQALERAAAHWCHSIVSVNNEDREEALRLGIGKHGQVITIENGVNQERFDQSADGSQVRRELGIDSSGYLVGFIGRLSAQKDPATFLRAAKSISTRIPDAHFVLAGEGPDMERMQQLARDLSIPNVHFLGFRRDIPEILAAMDLFVLTSRWEGLPISVLEAMAAGKSIVATNIKGTRELVVDRKTGLLVPAGDPAATACAIAEMHKSPDLARRCAKNASEMAANCYTEDRMQKRILRLYVWLISNHHHMHASAHRSQQLELR